MKKLIIFHLCMFFIVLSGAQTPTFVWVKQIGVTQNDPGQLIIIDNTGNVYTLGSYRDMVDFEPEIRVFTLHLVVFNSFLEPKKLYQDLN